MFSNCRVCHLTITLRTVYFIPLQNFTSIFKKGSSLVNILHWDWMAVALKPIQCYASFRDLISIGNFWLPSEEIFDKTANSTELMKLWHNQMANEKEISKCFLKEQLAGCHRN